MTVRSGEAAYGRLVREAQTASPTVRSLSSEMRNLAVSGASSSDLTWLMFRREPDRCRDRNAELERPPHE